jgi:hypothetical protein
MNSHIDMHQGGSDSTFLPFVPVSRTITGSDHETIELTVERRQGIFFFPMPFPDSPAFRLVPGDAAYVDLPQVALTGMPQQTKALSPGLQRIQARQPEVIHRAIELRAVLGDPILGLARVLQGVPVVEDDVWDRIAQEPYG